MESGKRKNFVYPHIAAKKIGKSTRTIYRLIQKGDLASIKDSNGKLRACLPENISIAEITVDAIALTFSISKRTVYNWIKKGFLKPSKTLIGNRFTIDEVIRACKIQEEYKEDVIRELKEYSTSAKPH